MNKWNAGVPVPDEMNNHPVSQVISEDWDSGDPWGSSMSEGFAVCDFVTFHLDSPHEIPMELGYCPAGGGCPQNASEDDTIYEDLVRCFEAGDFTATDVFEYLPVLNRYLDACKVAGVDY